MGIKPSLALILAILPPSLFAQSKPELREGQMCRLSSTITDETFVADAKSGLAALAKLIEAIVEPRDPKAKASPWMERLTSNGDAFSVYDGCSAKVLRVGKTFLQVEILEGPTKGRNCLVLKEWAFDPRLPRFKVGDRCVVGEFGPGARKNFRVADIRAGKEGLEKLLKARGTDEAAIAAMIKAGDVFEPQSTDGKILDVLDTYYEVELRGRRALVPFDMTTVRGLPELNSLPVRERNVELATRRANAKRIADAIRKEAQDPAK